MTVNSYGEGYVYSQEAMPGIGERALLRFQDGTFVYARLGYTADYKIGWRDDNGKFMTFRDTPVAWKSAKRETSP